MLEDDTRSIYFGADTQLIPELRELPDRFGPIDVALVPTNGLHIVPMGKRKVVMDAREAADLVRILKPGFTIPENYAFTGGWRADRLLARGDRCVQHFVDAAGDRAPGCRIQVMAPGETVTV